MKKIETKDIEAKAKDIFAGIGRNIASNTWYFTVLFFVAILFVSLWVWWNCFQNPIPSNEVILKVEQGKVDYNGMKKKTESVITSLQESRDRFENPPFLGDQREIFWQIDPENPKDSLPEQQEAVDEVDDTEIDTPKEEEEEDSVAL